MRISVIVTTYNRPEALQRVLAGLADQSRAPDEVIVADDGSGPETTRQVEAFAGRSSLRVDHVWQPDEGFRAAAIRNAAVRRAAGDYIVFLDGDCIPAAHFVADHLRLAQTGHFFQGGRVLVSRRLADRFDPAHRRRRDLWADLVRGDLGNGHRLLHLPAWPARCSRRLSGIRSCNLAVFRSDLYAVNGFNEDFVGWGREDSELAVRLFRFGLKRKSHPFMAACFHLWHPDNDRSRLADNDRRLARRISGAGWVCANGLAPRDGRP